MSQPTDSTAICNISLDYLRQRADLSTITNPTTPEEHIFSRHYDMARRSLLRKYVWNFAKEYDIIPLHSESPPFKYTDAYPLPNDCIRINQIGESLVQFLTMDYDIKGRRILLNNSGAASIKIIYNKDVKIVNEFDPLFVEALALKVALKVAYKFTQKEQVVARLRAMYEEVKQDAASVDGQENPPIKITSSKINRARVQPSGYRRNHTIEE